MRDRAGIFLVATAIACGVTACSDKEQTPPVGELILALQTDMDLPKDVDKVRIRVASYGNTVFSNDYPVGPNELRIPATLALIANAERPAAPVTIQVIGFRQSKARVMRESITTIPKQRIATLRVPIEWLCDESAKTESGEVVSNCSSGDTCIAGTCTAAFVDSETLPDFTPGDVFGGGDGSGNGTCFDVGQCFSNPISLTVDTAKCTAVLPADDVNLNVALKLPGMGDGICKDGVCLVPLDGGEGGQWKRSPAGQGGVEIHLPAGVCERFLGGKVEAVIASKQCSLKTVRNPTCGPWSSAGNITKPGGEGGSSDLDATTVDVGSMMDTGGKADTSMPDTGGTLDAPSADVPATDDAVSTDHGVGDVMPPFDVTTDPVCMTDNCGQPPNCAPPPPPADGGFCNGVVSNPKPVSMCRWNVPGEIVITGMGFCGNLLNLQLSNLPGGQMAMMLPQTQCDQGVGWRFDTNVNQIELCSSSCATSTSPGVNVDFIYGCPTINGPPPDGGPGLPDGGPGPINDGGIFDGPVSGDAGPPDGDGGTSGMVPVPGGGFSIGCAAVDTACSADETLHPVTISDFSIDETEVTQASYQTCVGVGMCAAPPCGWDPANQANFPVTCVSWDEANFFCNWLGKRLPSEAEWEVAARGMNTQIYPWGNTTPDCSRANFSLCSFNQVHAVRSFVAGMSPYKAHDMAGNAAEWVLDWYGTYETAGPPNPMGPAAGTNRVVRGGDHNSPDADIRTSKRDQSEPSTRSLAIGFRCAKPGLGP